MTYSEKLKDPRWQKKRLEIMQRDNFQCVTCGEKDKTLHVHHLFYISGRMPWEYLDANFRTLCWQCHESCSDPSGPNAGWEQVHNRLDCESAIILADEVNQICAFRKKTSEQVVSAVALWLSTQDAVDFINEFNSAPDSQENRDAMRAKRGGIWT